MIIGITGRKHSGKSTAADYLIAGYGFQPVSFAQPLKDSVAALFDITVEQIEELKNDPNATVALTFPSGMRLTMSFRVFLQRYGTEAHRDIPEFGKDVWVTMADDKLSGGADERVVIADVRFENEAEVIRHCGGTIWEIVRNSLDAEDNHESESGVESDLIIFNDNGIEDLYRTLDSLVTA